MIESEKNADFMAVNHEKGIIKLGLSQFTDVQQGKPVEIHFKDDGSVDNKPSLCLVIMTETTSCVYGQISLEMLNNAIEQVGYKLIKTS